MKNNIRYIKMNDAVTGKVVQAQAQGLMVHSLDNTHWDNEADVDLLGHLF